MGSVLGFPQDTYPQCNPQGASDALPMRANGQEFALRREWVLPELCLNSMIRPYGGACGTTTGAVFMITLQIEHEVRDFATWKEAFDSDPLDRSASGVRSFRISRPLDKRTT